MAADGSNLQKVVHSHPQLIEASFKLGARALVKGLGKFLLSMTQVFSRGL
jgi:hypothetical protein